MGQLDNVNRAGGASMQWRHDMPAARAVQWSIAMRGQLVGVVYLGLTVTACGDTLNERMVTGGLGGGAAGGIIGGPVGALVGGGVGAVLGATLDESADVKVNKLASQFMPGGQQAASTGQAPRTEPAGAAERSRPWSTDQVHTKLHDVGYQRVYNIRQQDGVYLARGEREGRAYDVRVDAGTGRIISSEDVGRAAPRAGRGSNARSGAVDEQRVRAALHQEGYDRIANIQRSGDNYRAQAVRDNAPYDVIVDARTGRIISASPASRQSSGAATSSLTDDAQVRSTLQREGYERVSDLRREDGMYIARAQRNGEPYTVRVDAQTGRIVRSEPASSGGEPTMSAPPPR